MTTLKQTLFSFIAALVITVIYITSVTLYQNGQWNLYQWSEHLFDPFTILNFCLFWMCLYITIDLEAEKRAQDEFYRKLLQELDKS